MKQSISKYQFERAFADCGRENQFSREALELLFDWFEQYEEDCGTEIDLDPIAICCDFTEATRAEIISYYDCADRLLLLESPQPDPEDIPTEAVAEYLGNRTLYVGVTDPSSYSNLTEQTFIFQSF